MSDSAISPTGDVLISNRYSIRKKLGAGSIGSVYLARDELRERHVAVKILRPERLEPDGLERMQQEFSAIVSLHHPQIAEAYDFGYAGETRLPYYTREYVEGTPLPPGPPPVGASSGQFLKPFLDLLEALHYLHAHDILHLDIHAGNLIVSHDERRGAVLIDFGLMKPLRRSGSAFLEYSDWIPPELLRGVEPTVVSDLYAAGRLLLYRLTGRADGEPKLPHEIPGWGPRLTLELERILGKSLQQDPRQRFQSAEEFRKAVSSAAGRRPTSVQLSEPGEVTVGRESEIQAIEKALEDGVRGLPSALWFQGPDGIGKTRLLTEARLRAQLRGLHVVDARFVVDKAGEPLLLSALGAVRRGRRPAWLEPLEIEHGGSTSERAARAAAACFGTTGPPLVLLLDDLEHADTLSRALSEALLAQALSRRREGTRGRGVTLILTSSGALDPSPGIPSRSKVIRSLRPLDQTRSTDLLEKLLRPLKVPRETVRRLVAEARGLPFRLRLEARALHAEFGARKIVPAGVDLDSLIPDTAEGRPLRLQYETPLRRGILETLAVFRTAAGADELAAVLKVPQRELKAPLGKLVSEELVASYREGRKVAYHLSRAAVANRIVRGLPRKRVREIHRRAASFLEERGAGEATVLERLSRHLLGAGMLPRARELALEAARLLREGGLVHSAVRLLTDVAASESSERRRLALVEEISSLHELAGDHAEAVALLEPVYRQEGAVLRRPEAIRIRRRLGVHYHGAGRAEEAQRLFAEVERLAHPRRDIEELLIVDSELAELHALRGDYEEAEGACRRGLERLGSAQRLGGEFRSRMDVMLRASLGHVELRRLRLDRAKAELSTAARLARSHGTTTVEAYVLNNLGIACNQANGFSSARRHYLRAQRLLARIGDQQGAIHTACNLATIAAKRGHEKEAMEHLEEAQQRLQRFPGRRSEFVVDLAVGMVRHLLGDMARAVDALGSAIARGAALGDRQHVSFARVYLAEALAACGRYGEALRLLRSLTSQKRQGQPPVLRRMAWSRLGFIEALVGGRREVLRCRRALEEEPRTGIVLLEAWVDLFLAHANLLEEPVNPDEADRLLEAAGGVFARLGIPAGVSFARAALLTSAIARGDARLVRSRLRTVESADPAPHRLLWVLEPLVCTQACLLLGEVDRAAETLSRASGATVGFPFLELDVRVEQLQARIAERRGDRESARRHVHRAIHTRDLLSRNLPRNRRKRFQAGPRFAALADLMQRLQRPVATPVEAGSSRPAGSFRGMIGQSSPMIRVFQMIDRLSEQDLPVLITGATGTGKELVARALHATGPRREGPFVVFHCASLPPELFESELFGHEAGAFTGADISREGLLDCASGGTVLLDEISSLSLETQAKLLRVLDTGLMRPLGSTSERAVDVRFLAATNRDLHGLIAQKAFREDLYYRLGKVEIRLPLLEERRGDIPHLARHFLMLHSARLERTPPLLRPDAIQCLEDHDWPGNVRELEAVLLRLLFESPSVPIDAQAVRHVLPARTTEARTREPPVLNPDTAGSRDLEELHRELDRAYLTRLFRESGGDLGRMMETLGVKRSSLYRWFRRVGVDPARLRREL